MVVRHHSDTARRMVDLGRRSCDGVPQNTATVRLGRCRLRSWIRVVPAAGDGIPAELHVPLLRHGQLGEE